MPSFFHKPENALKRAHEFIDVGKEDSALDVLNDVIRSRKHRQKWTATHEDIMLLYTSLCVRLQRSSFAKDGLYQYRTICKEVNPHSFERVIKSFLKLAEEKADGARQQSEATVLEQVEDLDAVVTPESLLLSTVSGEGAKERTDRVLLTPWVKFLWESYRNMLELLKNSLVNLTVYADVAKSAFKFCINYQRRMEFRKLCDILRNHLTQAEKYQAQQHSLKLDQPEVITGLVDVRFEQLESSIAVDLWQEAFRAIEEIHKLLNMSGKSPKASLLDNFYSQQAKVYMMAKNQLFHAAALHKLFVLRKEQKKNLTKEEAKLTASQVMLATLSVPIEPVPSETDRFLEVDDNSRDKARRLAALLRMDTPPTRATLMRDMLQQNVLQLVPQELQELYQHLEVDFDPLELCAKVVPILEQLEEQEHVGQYVGLLREITLVRLIKQVSQVYETIELSRLVELAPFATTTDLEKVVVETAMSNNIQVRIDHSTNSLRFGTDMSFSRQGESPEGPFIQSMPSEILCNQLTMMSQALQQAVSIVSALDLKAERQAITEKTYQNYQRHAKGDHRKACQRGKDIEDRKEFIENQRNALIKQKEDERQQKLQQERKEEQNRLNREAEEREKERVKKEIEEMQLKIKQEKLDSLKSTAVGKKAFADITSEDLKNMDADVIFSKQLKQIEKEKRDREIKLKTQEKKIDYFERAKRLVEIPLLEKQYEEQRKSDREFHTEQENQKISLAIKERREAEEANVRLKVMRGDEAKFRRSLEEKRREKYEKQMEQFEVKLAAAREERLAVRRKERMERRKAEAEAARKEEEARQVKLKREEEERKAEEERKQREEEREEALAKQRKREEEMEEKLRQKEQRELEEMRERKEREREREDQGGGGGGGGGAYRPPGRRGDDHYESPRRERRAMPDEGDWRRDGEDRREDKRDFGRDERRDFGRGDRRDFGRDDRRDFGRDDRRDFGRDDRRDFGRGDRRDFGRDDRRDFSRDDRRDFGRDERRDFDRRDFGRGARDGYDREDRRGPPRDYDRRGPPPRDGGWRQRREEGEEENWQKDRPEEEESRRDRGDRGDEQGGWRSRQREEDQRGRDEDWRGGGGRRGGGYDGERRRENERSYREDDRDRGGYRGGGGRDLDRGRDMDRRPRDRGYERDGGRGYEDRDRRPPPRDYDQDRPPRGREGGGGDRWRDREDGRGEKWRGGGGGGGYGDRGLKAEDRRSGWRGSDRSPGPGRDRGRESSPRRVDEDGFETVNRRR